MMDKDGVLVGRNTTDKTILHGRKGELSSFNIGIVKSGWNHNQN